MKNEAESGDCGAGPAKRRRFVRRQRRCAGDIRDNGRCAQGRIVKRVLFGANPRGECERTLCFTNAELDALEEAREAQRLEAQKTQPFEGRDAERTRRRAGRARSRAIAVAGASDGGLPAR